MEVKRKRLIMVSQRFPFGRGELYLEREIAHFLKHYDAIELFPLKAGGEARLLDKRVTVHNTLYEASLKSKLRLFFRGFFQILYVYWIEFFFSKKAFFLLKRAKSTLGDLTRIYGMSVKFRNDVLNKFSQDEMSFYSVWMDEGATMFGMLKRSNHISDFVFRLHGYDIYDERREGNYMPYRYFCFKWAKKVFIVSEAGKNYLVKKNVFPEKITVNYSGLDDYGAIDFTTLEKERVFTLISCSAIIPLKRVHRILEVIEKIDRPVHWIHVGGGDALINLQQQAATLKTNCTTLFTGHLSFSALMELYQSKRPHVFIHLSETEGLPLSIAEAQSFGLPVIATNVGGTAEIVNASNGYLIDRDFENQQVVDLILSLMQNRELHQQLSVGARNHFLKNFVAEKNYERFIALMRD